jgi:hypothetical protein
VGESGVETGAVGVTLQEWLAGAEHGQPQGLGEHAQGPLPGVSDGGFAAEQADGGDLQAGQQAGLSQCTEEARDLRIEHVDGGLAEAEQAVAAGGVTDQVERAGARREVEAAFEDLA